MTKPKRKSSIIAILIIARVVHECIFIVVFYRQRAGTFMKFDAELMATSNYVLDDDVRLVINAEALLIFSSIYNCFDYGVLQ